MVLIYNAVCIKIENQDVIFPVDIMVFAEQSMSNLWRIFTEDKVFMLVFNSSANVSVRHIYRRCMGDQVDRPSSIIDEEHVQNVNHL